MVATFKVYLRWWIIIIIIIFYYSRNGHSWHKRQPIGVIWITRRSNIRQVATLKLTATSHLCMFFLTFAPLSQSMFNSQQHRPSSTANCMFFFVCTRILWPPTRTLPLDHPWNRDFIPCMVDCRNVCLVLHGSLPWKAALRLPYPTTLPRPHHATTVGNYQEWDPLASILSGSSPHAYICH